MIEKCGRCGFENLEGSLFCQKCGSQLITKNVSFIQKIQGRTLLKKTFWTLVLIFAFIVLIWLYPKNENAKISQSNIASNYISITTDPDPIVECQFTHLPWQKMKSSECSTSVECQIDNKWNIYKSQKECVKDQQQISTNAIELDPIIDCPFKNFPAQKMRESECKNAVECEVDGKWNIYTSRNQCSQYQSLQVSNDWSKYRATRINDLKAARKITEDQIEYYKKELDKLTKGYDQVVSLYKTGERTKEEFETVSKSVIEADNFIRSTLKELAKEADAFENLILRFQNGENITPEEERAIVGFQL